MTPTSRTPRRSRRGAILASLLLAVTIGVATPAKSDDPVPQIGRGILLPAGFGLSVFAETPGLLPASVAWGPDSRGGDTERFYVVALDPDLSSGRVLAFDDLGGVRLPVAAEVEEASLELGRRVGRVVLECGLTEIVHKCRVPVCCGRKMGSRGNRPITVSTMTGRVVYERRRHRCGTCGHEVYAGDTQILCGPHRLTMPLAKRVCQLATTEHFTRLPRLIADQHGIEIGHQEIAEIVHEVGGHADRRRQPVQPHADGLVAVERHRTDVAVLPVALVPQQLDQAARQVGRRDIQLHAQQARRIAEAPEVILGAEHEELSFIGVPVAADPREQTGPVVERVREQTERRLAVGDDLAVQVGPMRDRRGRSHF